jgi:hypothetical protein
MCKRAEFLNITFWNIQKLTFKHNCKKTYFSKESKAPYCVIFKYKAQSRLHIALY